MDPMTALTLISTAVQVAGSVKELLDKGGVTPQSLEKAAPQIVPQLASLGASLFPKVAPEMQAVAAAFSHLVRISRLTASMGRRRKRQLRLRRKN